MKYGSIADIYSANEYVRGRFNDLMASISDEEATASPDGEAWSIQKIVEHVAIVESGMLRICTKLLGEAKAAGKPFGGSVSLSSDFGARSAEIAGLKVEAPERVHPTGEVSLPEALEQMTNTTRSFDGLRPDFESFDVTDHKFPHPFFGDLNAIEWLVLKGGHEARHAAQIKKILEKLRPA